MFCLSRIAALVPALLAIAFVMPGPLPAAAPTSRTLVLAPGEAPGEWSAGQPDTALKAQGRASWLWVPARQTALHLSKVPADWTPFNVVRFDLHNNVPTPTWVQFIVCSEDPAKDGMDYWTARIPLDFTGWRHFEYHFSDLARIRDPRGWDKINSVYFSADYSDNKADPRTQLHVDDFALSFLPPATGPRLTDAEFFRAFNLDTPGLEAVKAAVAANDMARARAACCQYLRTRATRTWYYSPRDANKTISYKRETADAAVNDEFTVVQVKHRFPLGKIDWKFNAMANRKDMSIDYEWQWQLGRMWYWNDMGKAYWATGDEKYARAWVRQLESWIHDCPVPATQQNGTWSSWRTIEAGIRMFDAWPHALHRFLLSPSVPDDALVNYVKSSIEHARYLRRFHNESGNWLGFEMRGLHVTGCVFPELREAEGWRRYAIDVLHRQIEAQFLPDGAQGELTPGYGRAMLESCLSPLQFSKTVGREAEVPDGYAGQAARAFEYLMNIMTPNRNVPQFNDTWYIGVPGTLREAVELFPQRQDLLWIHTEGAKGAPPAYTSVPLRWSGHFIMRSGWEKDANYLAFDNGPLGAGHDHQDKLNVVCYPYGRRLLFDNGGGSYERNKMRAYSVDTFSHNTVLLDGMPQRRINPRWKGLTKEPIDGRWESDAAHDFTAGVYDEAYAKESESAVAKMQPAPRPGAHTRRILFVKPDVFVVADTLVPSDTGRHAWQARWHLLTTAAAKDAAGAVATADAGLPNLALVPLATDGLLVQVDSGVTEPELLGWDNDKGRKPRPATTVRHTVEGAGTRHLITLLLPLRPGEKNPVTKVESTGPASARVTLGDGRVWTVEASVDPSGAVTFAETRAGGAPGRRIAGGAGR